MTTTQKQKCNQCEEYFNYDDLNDCKYCDELTCNECNQEHGHMGGISDIGYEEDDGEY